MAYKQLHTVLRHLHHLAGVSGVENLTDRQLLHRFTAQHDEDAFAALVHRHGPMVMGVCQRVLGHAQDAEDAFQAVFLVLARKAASMCWRESAANWLYGVALRLARESKIRSARQRRREREADSMVKTESRPEEDWRELCGVMDEELHRLPERYRQPLLLCYLEGQTRDRAAQRLGLSLRTLHRRLERGLALLRARLMGRGLTLSAALVAVALSRQTASASVSTTLLRSTIGAALAFASKADNVPMTAAALAGGILSSMKIAKVKIISIVLLASLLAAGAGAITYRVPAAQPQDKAETRKPPAIPAREQAKAAQGKKPDHDLSGDPLPKGALARLGTSRLRGYRWASFLPDGRRLVRPQADGSLQIFAVPTGKPLVRIHGTDIPKRKEIIGSTLAFSRDGKYLAAVCWEGGCGIWEAATGRLVRWLESGEFYSILKCDFSPDGKLLAVGKGAKNGMTEGLTVGVYEVKSGRQLFATLGTNSVFAPDGKSLITWNGYNHGGSSPARRVAVPSGEQLTLFTYVERFPDGAPRSDGVWFFGVADQSVRVWNVASGKVKHTLRGPGGGENETVYVRRIAGRREVLAVGTQPPGIWCWDIDTGKELWHRGLASPAYFPKLSEDGKTLVTGENAGTVRVWDVDSGKERASFRPGAIGQTTSVEISPDGKTVATDSGGGYTSTVALWDAASGKLLTDLSGHPSGITATTFSPDGTKIYTIGKDKTLRTWDAASGRELARVSAKLTENLAISADGKTLFVAGPDSGSVRILDAQSGRLERQIPLFKHSLIGLVLTADGKRLIAAGRDAKSDADALVRICDAGTGAKLGEFTASDAKLEQLAVRLDGGAMATSHEGQRVVLWDAKGKKLSEQIGKGQRVSAWPKGETPYRIGSLGLSPDGRWLAYSDQEQGIAIVNARTGREVGLAKLPGVYYQNGAARYELHDVLAFSPDGKTVAWSGVESTADIFLIEARTHQLRRKLPGDSQPVQHLAFSPDGSRLLSAGPDGSALIWDVLGRLAVKPGTAARAEEIAAWWDALGEANAEKAYQTMRRMAAHPSAAVELLRAKLKPIEEVPAAKFDALLAKLDGDAFKAREEATRELVALGDAVEPRLWAVLRKSPSLEVKRRVEDVLTRIDASRLRAERAVEVLEMIGDAAARKLLREWASGLPGAALTRDAAGAINREFSRIEPPRRQERQDRKEN